VAICELSTEAEWTTSQSPLKARPLPNPGDSTEREIRGLADDKLIEVFFFAGGFSLVALMEWIGYLTHSPRHPGLFTSVALAACIVGAWRVRQIRRRLKQLKLGRDGEKCVGQFLERLRNGGSHVFHDIPASGFNLDHVIISPPQQTVTTCGHLCRDKRATGRRTATRS
jgi:hypothetical protein